MTREDIPPIIIAKKAAGQAAAQLVQDGMLIGLGTGSTIAFFIEALGQRCKEGLRIQAVATSVQSMHHAQKVGIPLETDQNLTGLDMVIDGADEIDHRKNMIKGGGGALLREKLLASASDEMIVVVDENKLVEGLGAFPVPVEISSFAFLTTVMRLLEQGYQGVLRLNRDRSIYVTDNGNYIFDIQFDQPIHDPRKTHQKIKGITGVIETGLFFNIAGRVVVGYQDGFARIQT